MRSFTLSNGRSREVRSKRKMRKEVACPLPFFHFSIAIAPITAVTQHHQMRKMEATQKQTQVISILSRYYKERLFCTSKSHEFSGWVRSKPSFPLKALSALPYAVSTPHRYDQNSQHRFDISLVNTMFQFFIGTDQNLSLFELCPFRFYRFNSS